MRPRLLLVHPHALLSSSSSAVAAPSTSSSSSPSSSPPESEPHRDQYYHRPDPPQTRSITDRLTTSMALTNDPNYKKLERWYKSEAGTLNMRDLFEQDQDRFSKFRSEETLCDVITLDQLVRASFYFTSWSLTHKVTSSCLLSSSSCPHVPCPLLSSPVRPRQVCTCLTCVSVQRVGPRVRSVNSPG